MFLGEVIKQYRIENKITMAEFAEKSNLSKGYISMLENNRNPQNNRTLVPSVETFNKVANAMGISIEELISMTNSDQPIKLNPDSRNEINYFYELFSSNLLRLLHKNNLTQKEVADTIGVSPQTFNTWCKGVALPRMDKVDALAKYFNVSRSDLISEPTPKVDKNIEFIPNMTTTKIKVYGSVPAGVPVTAIEDIQGTVDIPSHWLSSGYDYMGIVVKGDSMFPKYQEGDIVVIRVQPDCENGQDCVVYINGDEATLKKVIKNSDCIILQPMNPEYAPIVVDYNSEDFKILGVVVQLVRYV